MRRTHSSVVTDWHSKLLKDWRRFVQARKLPRVSFQVLRHTRFSALIAAKLGIFTISGRIGFE